MILLASIHRPYVIATWMAPRAYAFRGLPLSGVTRAPFVVCDDVLAAETFFGSALVSVVSCDAVVGVRFTGRQGDREIRGRGPRFSSDLDPRRLSRNAVAFRSKIRASLSTWEVVPHRHWRPCRLHTSEGALLVTRASQGRRPSALSPTCTCKLKSEDDLSPCSRDGCMPPPEGLGMEPGERSVCAMNLEPGSEISPSEGNVKASRGRDPHEVRAREVFTFPEGPTRVQVERERRPLPLISLSPCLPVNLSREALP